MSGSTLMDLITSDPAPPPAAGASSQQPSSGSGSGSSGRSAPPAAAAPAPADRKSKRATLMQIQSDTISAAKAFNPVKNLPQRNRKKKARLLHRRVPHFSYHLCALFPVSLCILCSSCSPSHTRSWRGASTSLQRRATRFVVLLRLVRIA
jgi:hypothetical protein